MADTAIRCYFLACILGDMKRIQEIHRGLFGIDAHTHFGIWDLHPAVDLQVSEHGYSNTHTTRTGARAPIRNP